MELRINIDSPWMKGQHQSNTKLSIKYERAKGKNMIIIKTSADESMIQSNFSFNKKKKQQQQQRKTN